MKKIDLTSPVEVLACELPQKDYAACDLTLLNLSGDQVTSVEATLTLLDEAGEEIARVIHRARSLNGAPGQTFVMTIPAEDMTRAKDWEATVDKVWFDNSSIWRRSKNGLTEYEPNDLGPSNALNNLRAVAGEDAVGYPAEHEGLWVCVCGRPNDSQADRCVRCGRKKAEVFARYTQEAVEAALAEHESRLSEHGKQTVADSSAIQLQREQEYVRKRRRRRILIAVVAAVVLVFGGGYVGMKRIAPQLRYRKAVEAFDSGDWAQAEERFLALEDYGDSADYVLRCRYEAAKAQLEQGGEGIAAAREAFVALGDFEDAAALVSECDYREALALMNAGDREGAAAMFAALGDYQDSADQVLRIQYQDAADLLADGEYEQARAAFTALGEYDDATAKVRDTWYGQAAQAMEDGDPDGALALLEEIADDAEAVALGRQAHYMIAVALREAGEIDAAAEEFTLAGDYQDAALQASECFYAPAQAAFEAGQYDRAAELFGQIRGYEDADDKWTVSTYEAAKRAIKDLEYARAATLLASLPEDYEDVAGLRQESVYRPALAAYERGEYETALEMFSEIADYSDAQEQIERSRYAMAKALYEQGDMAAAIEQFTLLGDYSDAAKQLQAAQYAQAEGYLALGTAEGYQQAMDAFTALEGYSDSADKLKAARFGQAELMLADGDWAQARPIFEALGDYGGAAQQMQACDYQAAAELYAQGQLEEAAALYRSIEGYGDALAQAQAIAYEQGKQAAEQGDTLTAARYFGLAGDHEDAKAQAGALYDVYYGDAGAKAQTAYNGGDYTGCVRQLQALDMSALPKKYTALAELYREACYAAGNQLYDAGEPYAALPYYREITGYRNVDERLQRACYLILGVWTDLNGTTYVFSEDGTLTIGGEKLYFEVDGTTLLTGASPEVLAETHRLTGVTRRNAWLYDRRSGKEITIYLTRDEAAAAALAAAKEEVAADPVVTVEEEAAVDPLAIPLPVEAGE